MSRSYSVEGCELCDVGWGFVSAVCMCKTVEEYIHGDEFFTGEVFTGEVFTGGLFTVRSNVLRLSTVAVSAVGVPAGHLDSIGCSNIGTMMSQ